MTIEIPSQLISKMILDAIIIQKISVGWDKIHDDIKLMSYKNTLQYVFCTDENGNYLDDVCGDISYW